MTYSESDIAIVGMNCRYPGVHSVAAFETVLRTGCNILDPKVTPSNGHTFLATAVQKQKSWIHSSAYF